MSTAAPVVFEITTAPVTRTQIVRFAGVGGDFNPMHHDEEFARAAGQPSVFAMGQLTAAIIAAAVSDHLGAEHVSGYGVRFKDKVWPGDRLIIRAVEAAEDSSRLELTATRAGDGQVVASGWVAIR